MLHVDRYKRRCALFSVYLLLFNRGISVVLVFFEKLNDLLEVIEAFRTVVSCFKNALETNATIKAMLILKAPVATCVPLLGKTLLPVLQELVS